MNSISRLRLPVRGKQIVRHVLPTLQLARSFSLGFSGIAPSMPLMAPKKKGGKDLKGNVDTTEVSHADNEEIEEGKDLKSTLDRQVDYVRRELSKLRGSAASANMLDHVQVEAYGDRQSLKDLAQISLRSAQLMVVTPFDSSLADAISEAILNSGLNLNPIVEANYIRVPIPKASKETRDAALKMVSKIAEQGKTRVRRVRASALEKIKKQEGVSEDLIRSETKDIEKVVADANAEIAGLADKKKKEIESPS